MKKKLIILASLLLTISAMGNEQESEVLIFTNGQYFSGRNKTIKDFQVKINQDIPLTPLEPSIPVKPDIPLIPLEPSTPIPKPDPIIWEEGREILEKVHTTDKNLQATLDVNALKGIRGARIINNHVITNSNGLGIFIDSYSYAENNNLINVNQGVALYIKGDSKAVNNGTIDLIGSDSSGGNILGDGEFINKGTINSIGIGTVGISARTTELSPKVTMINEGTINVKERMAFATQISGSNKGNVIVKNTGTINVTNGGNGMGFQAYEDSSKFLGINDGDIIVSEGNGVKLDYADYINNGYMEVNNEYGNLLAYNVGKNVFTNNGEIKLKNGELIATNGLNPDDTFKNNGSINSDVPLDLTNAIFIQGASGTIVAPSITGDIIAGKDISNDNYEKNITMKIATDNYKGNISSESIMYDSSLEKTKEGYEIILNRKSFIDVSEDKNLGNYLEKNYIKGNNLKNKLFNDLKGFSTSKELNKGINSTFGNKIIPNLNKQTLDSIKFTNETLKKNVFDTKTTTNERIIVGGNYGEKNVDSSNLSGYQENINSMFIGLDKKIKNNLRVGGVLAIGKLDSQFTYDKGKREDNLLQFNMFTQYNHKDWDYILNGYIGKSHGDLERELKLNTINSTLKTDIENTFYGLNTIIRKNIESNGLLIKPQFEINSTYLKFNGINEKGNYGVNTSKENFKSFEVGTGITISKKLNFINDSIITPKIGGSYLYEFGSPYKGFKGQILDISTDKFEISKNNIDKGRLDLTIGLDVEKGNLKVYGDYKYNIQLEENTLTAGLIYKFN